MRSLDNKSIVVVLGMSRSGTSAIARALQALGVNLGEKLLQGDGRNPKGFYEDADVLYNINRGVSSVLDHPWMTVGAWDAQQMAMNPLLKEYKKRTLKLVQARLIGTENWGFKDPRTITILPFWQSVFQELPVEDKYVIVMRNPLAAATSNKKFSGMDIETGLLLWLGALFAALEGTQGKKRVVVSYETMLRDPYTQIERMREALALPVLETQAIDEYAKEFLDQNLRHYAFSEAELQTHPAMRVVPLCLQLYELLLRHTQGEITLESDAFQHAWQGIRQKFMLLRPMYQYVFNLLKQNKQIERQLRQVHKSVPWKLTYPLRVIEDGLRALRHRGRNRRRLVKLNEA